MLLLCACQETPETQAVISKNDGVFEENATVTASETHEADATQTVQCTSSFTSTDGSVNYTVNIDQEITNADMPILIVTPHYFTNEDALNRAYAIFGEDATYYEMEPTLADASETMTKSDLQSAIQRLSQYTTDRLCRFAGPSATAARIRGKTTLPAEKNLVLTITRIC